jgi:membrane fusion protein (multidrug efflux system)
VAVQTAEVGSIASYYTATATLAAEKEAEVLARVAGVVQALGCEEGDVVREGSELLRIDNAEYLYRLQQATADRADLESRYERLQKMIDQNLVSAEEYEGAKNELESARAAEGLAELNLSYTRVKAPFTGRVVTRHVDVGQNVSAGTPLFVLSDFDPLLARIHVPAKEFNKLKVDQPVDLVLESNGAELTGRIKLISPVIDPSSGTIKVTVEIPEYPADTRPGDFAQVSIVTERRMGSTLVPKIAVVTDRGERVVYVAAADSTAERHVVEIGFEDDDNAEIISGIDAGQEIVVKGQRSLKNGQRIKILEEGVAEADSNTQAGF